MPGVSTSISQSRWPDIISTSSLHVVGSTLYVTANFTSSPAGNNRTSPIALDVSTGALSAWNPDPSFPAKALAFSGPTHFVGGMFTKLNGGTVSRNNLAGVDATTGAATSWQPQGNLPIINKLGLFDSSLYLCGEFSTGLVYSYAVDPVTGAASAFNPQLDQACYDFAYDAATKTLIMGGPFWNAGDVPQSHLVLLSLAPINNPSTDGGVDGGTSTDAGTTDGGVVDAGSDAGSGADSGTPGGPGDGGTTLSDGGDGGTEEPGGSGCGCGTSDGGGAFSLLALLLARRRHRAGSG